MPLVKIKSDMSHGYRAADGSHAYHRAGDVFDASPAEMESFGDKFILVVEDEPVKDVIPWTEIVATPAARRLATDHGINLPLSGVTGTGKHGAITKADVQAVLNGDAE